MEDGLPWTGRSYPVLSTIVYYGPVSKGGREIPYLTHGVRVIRVLVILD